MSKFTDMDLAKVEAALKRAAARAKMIAIQTNTPLIVYEGGRVVKKYPGRKSAGRRHTMIKTHVIKESGKPLAVILDYNEFVRLKEIEQDKSDYRGAVETKAKTRKWTSHEELKKKLGL